MEAEAERAISTSNTCRITTRSAAKKRKPLSDLTNLIPSNTLHKPSIHISKPYNFDSKSKKPCPISSISDSSIGSSNYNNNNAPKPCTIPSTPFPKPSTHTSSTIPGTCDGAISEPLVVYTRKLTAEKTRSKGKAVTIPSSCSLPGKANENGKAHYTTLSNLPVEKTKDRGKAVDLPFSYSPVENTKEKRRAIDVPFSYCPVNKTKDKGKEIKGNFHYYHVVKTTDKGKAIDVPFSYPSVKKTKDKGEEIDGNFNYHPVVKTKDKGKVIAGHFNYHHVVNIKDKGKDIAGYSNYHPVVKVTDKGNNNGFSYCCHPLENIDKGKAVIATPGFSSLSKTKDKGKPIALPINSPTLEKQRDKRKGVTLALSCPPLPKTRNIGNELDEAEDIGKSKFHTHPHLMHKKKRCRLPQNQDTSEYDLPQDFIEQQRAYFKEVDEFELSEEEISDNEWAKEERESELNESR